MNSERSAKNLSQIILSYDCSTEENKKKQLSADCATPRLQPTVFKAQFVCYMLITEVAEIKQNQFSKLNNYFEVKTVILS
jgi:hypothetical protein